MRSAVLLLLTIGIASAASAESIVAGVPNIPASQCVYRSGDDPASLLTLRVTGRHGPGRGTVATSFKLCPQSVIDAKQRLDHQMGQVMDDVNRPAPGDPVHLQVGAVLVARPGRLHQGYLHDWHGSTVSQLPASAYL